MTQVCKIWITAPSCCFILTIPLSTKSAILNQFLLDFHSHVVPTVTASRFCCSNPCKTVNPFGIFWMLMYLQFKWEVSRVEVLKEYDTNAYHEVQITSNGPLCAWIEGDGNRSWKQWTVVIVCGMLHVITSSCICNENINVSIWDIM